MVTTGLDRADGAPKPVRLAFALSMAGTAVELVGWVLGSFVIAPTSWGTSARTGGRPRHSGNSPCPQACWSR